MKQFIVNTLFYMGDITGKIMLIPGFHWLFWTYNSLMDKSSTLQHKWKLDKPWKKPTE